MGWDVVSTVVGGLLGTAIAGPVGGVIGAATGTWLGWDDDPQHLPQKFPPYPGTVPGVPPYPSAPPPGAPPANPPGQGQAQDAANLDATQIAAVIEELTHLDQKAADAVAAIQAAGEQGRRTLDEIATSVDAKITELGPRLNTPQGQQELRDFLKEKLTAAKQVLDEQNQIALQKAREIQEIAERFNQLGKPADNGATQPASDNSGSTPGGAPASPDAAASTAPASSTDPAAPAAAPVTPQGLVPGATPTMPGMGSMMPAMGMPSMPMPSFGGMPSAGVGDPLSALSGLGTPAADEGLKVKDPAAQGDPATADPKLNDPAAGHDSAPGHDGAAADNPGNTDDATQPATQSADATATPGAGDAPASGPGAATSTDVRLPDGTTVHAASEQAATAVRAALGGASVSDAYQQAGITLPPAGSPVLDPIAPGTLAPGDVGVWKDHLVMALGDGKVLVSGQVQPQSSVGSGPDFLGWMRPVSDADPTPAPPPQAPDPQPPQSPAQS